MTDSQPEEVQDAPGRVWFIRVALEGYHDYDTKQKACEAIKNELCGGVMPPMLKRDEDGTEYFYSEPLKSRIDLVPRRWNLGGWSWSWLK